MDHGAWCRDLSNEAFVEAGSINIYMRHDLSRIDLDPAAADIRVVISGHTHRPSLMTKNGVLYINPGSASFPRGGFPASIAVLRVNGQEVICRHIEF